MEFKNSPLLVHIGIQNSRTDRSGLWVSSPRGQLSMDWMIHSLPIYIVTEWNSCIAPNKLSYFAGDVYVISWDDSSAGRR